MVLYSRRFFGVCVSFWILNRHKNPCLRENVWYAMLFKSKRAYKSLYLYKDGSDYRVAFCRLFQGLYEKLDCCNVPDPPTGEEDATEPLRI